MTGFDIGRAACLLGFHKPVQERVTTRYGCRTTSKGRSKKRWLTYARETVTVTYCSRCGKKLGRKRKLKWRY